MPNPQGLKELLQEDLTKTERLLLPSSFDVVGDILIFADFPKELEKKEKIIGEKILEAFKNIKVVCKKTENYSGIFRTPILKIIVGEDRKETIHKENTIRVKLDVEKVYFSPRLGHERERINKLVKEGESVLVMFSGCAVYPVNIAKNTKAKEIYGVEINPVAHKYGIENLKLNKVNNVKLFLGGVKEVLPKIRKKFDRALMPLPKSAEDFLDIALKKVKKNGILHFYDFLHESDFGLSEKKVIGACKKQKRKCKILNFVKCGQYGPGKYRVCVDARII
jgi:tRNA (guanine37-N1)-methyltransferase